MRKHLWDLISFKFHRVKRSRLSYRQMTSETLRYASDSSFRGWVLISLDCSWWFQTFKSFARMSGTGKNLPSYEVLIITVDNWRGSWYISVRLQSHLASQHLKICVWGANSRESSFSTSRWSISYKSSFSMIRFNFTIHFVVWTISHCESKIVQHKLMIIAFLCFKNYGKATV